MSPTEKILTIANQIVAKENEQLKKQAERDTLTGIFSNIYGDKMMIKLQNKHLIRSIIEYLEERDSITEK